MIVVDINQRTNQIFKSLSDIKVGSIVTWAKTQGRLDWPDSSGFIRISEMITPEHHKESEKLKLICILVNPYCTNDIVEVCEKEHLDLSAKMCNYEFLMIENPFLVKMNSAIIYMGIENHQIGHGNSYLFDGEIFSVLSRQTLYEFLNGEKKVCEEIAYIRID